MGTRRLVLVLIALGICGATSLFQPATAHRSGCHRWHSCPSDKGSYICGDLGYDTYCPKRPKAKTTPSKPVKQKPSRSAGLKAGDTISGRASVYDGDGPMLFVGKGTAARLIEIRLSGIDAPELRQPCWRGGQPWACGAEAADTLKRMMAGDVLVCRVQTLGNFGRPVSLCQMASRSINVEMVRLGFAVAYRKYPATDPAVWAAILSAEREAKRAKRGVWAGRFDMPWEWRKRGY